MSTDNEGRIAQPHTRVLRVVLNVTVRDMTEAELLDSGFGSDFGFTDEDEDALDAPTLDDVHPMDLARLMSATLVFDETQDEMFAGADIYARLTGAAVESAEWASAAGQGLTDQSVDGTPVCLIPNCGKRAPASDAFCADHRGAS